MQLWVVSTIAALATIAAPTLALIQPIRPTQYSSLSRSHGYTPLRMAFPLEEGQTTNMFEGPAALTQERDACGVGFIVNTQHGGRYNNNNMEPCE
jgi:hypothetical protein